MQFCRKNNLRLMMAAEATAALIRRDLASAMCAESNVKTPKRKITIWDRRVSSPTSGWPETLITVGTATIVALVMPSRTVPSSTRWRPGSFTSQTMAMRWARLDSWEILAGRKLKALLAKRMTIMNYIIWQIKSNRSIKFKLSKLVKC